MTARVERSGYRLGIMQTILLKEVGDKLALREGKGVIGTVLVDFHT